MRLFALVSGGWLALVIVPFFVALSTGQIYLLSIVTMITGLVLAIWGMEIVQRRRDRGWWR